MLNLERVESEFNGDICRLRFNAMNDYYGDNQHTKPIKNIRNCDIFIEAHNVLFFTDVRLFKYHTARYFNIRDIKNLVVRYNTAECKYEMDLRCIPESDEVAYIEKGELEKRSKYSGFDRPYDLWKLKRITDNTRLQIDGSSEFLKFEANYDYGFAGKFHGKLQSSNSNVAIICRMPEPHLTSPIQRSIDRDIDELKDFSREQYKLQFVELQVPEGHDNPMLFKFDYEDDKLSKEEEQLLHNLTRKSEDVRMPEHYEQKLIDCGLISILLPICYDIRTTSNESTCESGWTRSVLSSTLIYFEQIDSLREVVISFLRRSIIYPLHRNFDLGRKCVEDLIQALLLGPTWILKQLLQTYQMFTCDEHNRELFNRYYIADYIRYVHNNAYCNKQQMKVLGRNLKNVSLDVFKKHLRMGLEKMESDLLKEIINDMHISTGNSDDDTNDDDDDDDEDDDEDDDDDDNDDDNNEDDDVETDETDEDDEEDVNCEFGECENDVIQGSESDDDEEEQCSSSDTEENSVIEQRIEGYDNIKI